ncbi:efflux RND transporter permease subunit, partial [Cytophagaceae bacterium YF14B1]
SFFVFSLMKALASCFFGVWSRQKFNFFQCLFLFPDILRQLLRKQGMNIENAIRQAGEVRFLPIVLTSLTAIGGLIPIALSNSPLISPLAIVIIGGLISSTLLSRIVTPVVYKLIPPTIKTQE